MAEEELTAGGLGLCAEQAFENVPTSLEMRLQDLRQELDRPKVSISELRRLAAKGVPDTPGVRPLVWKLLLNFLPAERARWGEEASRKRAQYAQFREELILDPKRKDAEAAAARGEGGGGGAGAGAGADGELERAEAADDPLSLSTSSVWNAYFKDSELLEQIERDVYRTHPDMHFFSGSGEPGGAAAEHREQMSRVLLVYAKLNPGIKYVQGMNELLAPLYYVLRTDPDEDTSIHAEPDAFFLFMEILSEHRDCYCQQLDNSEVGIRATIARLSEALRQRDAALHAHLAALKVEPQFYAFRWITLMLTQEFPLPDVVQLWDSLLASGRVDGSPMQRIDSLLQVCLAMLIRVREELLAGDFQSAVKLLQRYPPVDVHAILTLASCLTLGS